LTNVEVSVLERRASHTTTSTSHGTTSSHHQQSDRSIGLHVHHQQML